MAADMTTTVEATTSLPTTTGTGTTITGIITTTPATEAAAAGPSRKNCRRST